MPRWMTIAVAGLVPLATSSVAAACELCRESTAVAGRAGAAPAVVSFNTSIFWMLGGMAAVGGFAAVGFYRTLRSGRCDE